MKSQTVANRPNRSVDDTARLSLATIGYQGAPLPAFLATLKAARVTLLLDVRGLPLSRRKGFSKTPLSEALMRIGIGYRHEHCSTNSRIRSLGAWRSSASSATPPSATARSSRQHSPGGSGSTTSTSASQIRLRADRAALTISARERPRRAPARCAAGYALLLSGRAE